uniref:Putative cytochrome n=1 Tax=Rhipicephalus pulchellus TaxID=72859 RepID=L7M8F7_RHIPC
MLHVFIAVLALLTSLLFWWVRRKYTFWSGKGVPHHTFWQYLRFCVDIYTKPLSSVVISNYKRYGRMYGSYQGTTPTLVVSDPDILREIMVSKFKNFSDRTEAQRVSSEVWRKSIMNMSGDEWKKARNVFTPALTSTRLRTITLKIKAVAERTASRVAEAAAQDKPVNFSKLIEHASLDTTAALNYSVDIDSENDKDHPLMKCVSSLYSDMAGWKLIMMFLMPGVYKKLQPDYPPKSSTDLFKVFVSHLMEERKANNRKEDDFLQVFMDADFDWEISGDENKDEKEKKQMTLDEITAQGILFFLAGVESVSTTLIFTAYYLAQHPEYQKSVIAEVDKTAGPKGEFTYESLQEMPCLEACIKEALRLAASESLILRQCTEETTVAGINFKPGMCVYVPAAAIHHDPEYFPEPDKFNPERFLPENKDSVKPFTFMPFGNGPRNCVGMRLGMLQVKTTLACLLRRVKLEACTETMEPLKFKPRQLLQVTDGPIILRAVPRDTPSS